MGIEKAVASMQEWACHVSWAVHCTGQLKGKGGRQWLLDLFFSWLSQPSANVVLLQWCLLRQHYDYFLFFSDYWKKKGCCFLSVSADSALCKTASYSLSMWQNKSLFLKSVKKECNLKIGFLKYYEHLKFGLVVGNPAHGRGVETKWSIWSFLTQAILWFHEIN